MVPYNQMKPHQLPKFIKLRNADGTENIHYSLFYDGVSSECKMIAQTELNETEEKKRKGMQMLRETLKREGISVVDDYILLCILRKCKYNFNKSEIQLMRILETRKMVLDKLQNTDMKRLEHVLDHMVIGFLPYRDKRGRPIFFTSPNINLELFDLDDCVICFYACLLFVLKFPMTSISGLIYIMENKTPAIGILYPLAKLFQRHLGDLKSFPGRLAKIEILNEIFIVRWTVNLVKPFLPAKFVGRINFYGNEVVNLRKTYHPDLLPEEFGGTMGPLSNKFYKEELLSFMRRCKNENVI